MTVDGDKALIRRLHSIDRKLSGPILRTVIRASTKRVREKAVELAPKRTGKAAKRLKVRAMKRKRGRVGFTVTSGQKDYGGETFYFPMADLGHKAGRRGLPNRKQVEGKRSLRRAFEATKEQTANDIRDGVRRGVDQAARGG